MEITKKRSENVGHDRVSYRPQFFRIVNDVDRNKLQELLESDEHIVVIDEIEGQLRELVKSLNPSIKIKENDYPTYIKQHLAGADVDQYGVWVFYPWCKRLIHLLDEEEFVEIRTNRNRYKITREEQATLQAKKIGVVGLSVGQSIALTLAMERVCGEIRLADFDTAELSNLNRIRTSVQNLGLKKTIIAAREIAEIDPFINVKIFNDGLTNENIDDFFLDGGKLDLLVEVCDGLDVKIISRFKARELKVPVVMDTNDRGMLDVERFDLQPDRPILHGLAEGLHPENIRNLTNEEKIPYILRMIGAESISTRLKASMIEVEQSINTWPQLASSVALGGAITTDVARRILLDQFHSSGRYYVDIDELIGDQDKIENPREIPESYLPPKELETKDLILFSNKYKTSVPALATISKETIAGIVKAAAQAPSGGNCQPWKFLFKDGRLYIFHDFSVSYSFLDYRSFGAYVAIGAAIENIQIKSAEAGLSCSIEYVENADSPLVAVVGFQPAASTDSKAALADAIFLRHTNRNIADRVDLDSTFYKTLTSSVSEYKDVQLDIVDNHGVMAELGDILSTAEKFVMMHPRGHFDAFNKELKWPTSENEKIKEGLDVATLGMSKGEVSALRIANDAKAISFVRDVIKGGTAFKKLSTKAVNAASALGIITMPAYSQGSFLTGGRALERVWLESNLRDVSFQPISQFTFLLARLVDGKGVELNEQYVEEFTKLKDRFNKLFPHLEKRVPIFIFRLCKAQKPEIVSLRKELDAVFIYQA